jgi:hypothetical protein
MPTEALLDLFDEPTSPPAPVKPAKRADGLVDAPITDAAPDLLPDGRYAAVAVYADTKDTAKFDGKYLKVEFNLVDGKHKGHRLWDHFTLMNRKPQAVEIGRKQLAKFCQAIGQLNLTHKDELLHRPVTLVVKKRPTGPDKKGVIREAHNEITQYQPSTMTELDYRLS